MRQVQTIACSPLTGKVRMEQDVIAQSVGCYRIVLIIAAERHPVVVQLLRTEYQYTLVAIFIVLNDSKRRECLTKTYTIGQDAAIVLFQLVDDGKCRITLEIIELIPDCATMEPRLLIGQHIF